MRKLATALILLGALLSLLLAGGAHLQLVEARRLMTRGQQVEGTITERRAGGRRSTRYTFGYAYAANGVTYTKTNLTIAYRDYQRIRVGQAVAVRYDPADAARSITTAELGDFANMGNRLFFPLIGLGLLVWAIRRMLGGPREREGART